MSIHSSNIVISKCVLCAHGEQIGDHNLTGDKWATHNSILSVILTRAASQAQQSPARASSIPLQWPNLLPPESRVHEPENQGWKHRRRAKAGHSVAYRV